MSGALAADRASEAVAGIRTPRIAPPRPARSRLPEYRKAATDAGIKLMPWQVDAAHYMTANVGERWLYREVCIVVARQNGKTTLLLPFILMHLRRGDRILHTAQNRAIPRLLFDEMTRIVKGDPMLEKIRTANGEESIRFKNGGRYILVAPRAGSRGHSVDLVLLDEIREHTSFELTSAIRPTLTASKNPQTIYLSNAGSDESVVLNDLKRRGEKNTPGLAYLEWSAAPERAMDDPEGWREANPGLGYVIQPDTLAYDLVNSTPAEFETEHLCRWVTTMAPKVVDVAKWQRLQGELDAPLRPFMAISLDAAHTRASAVLAWKQADSRRIAVRLQVDVVGSPIDVDALGTQLRELSLRAGVREIAYDSLTDDVLVKYLKNAKPMTGRAFASACSTFRSAVEARQIVWSEADAVGQDLIWSAEHALAEGAWTAVKANDERPITAALAAIRAVQLASGPRPGAPVVR